MFNFRRLGPWEYRRKLFNDENFPFYGISIAIHIMHMYVIFINGNGSRVYHMRKRRFERWSGIYINSASGRTVLHFDKKSSVKGCKMGSSSLRFLVLLIVLTVTDAIIVPSYCGAIPTGETQLQ